MPLPTEKRKPIADLASKTVLIFGAPKIGKSSFLAEAEAMLFLATEPGLSALECYVEEVRNYEEFGRAATEIAQGNHTFKSIAIDTVDNLVKFASQAVEAKYGVDYLHDLSHGKGAGVLNNEIHRVLTKLAHLPYGLWLVSHVQTKTFKTKLGTEYDQAWPALPDKPSKTILGLVDLILYFDTDVAIVNGEMVEKRVIRTKPSARWCAGDRTRRLPATLPMSYKVFVDAYMRGDGTYDMDLALAEEERLSRPAMWQPDAMEAEHAEHAEQPTVNY